MEAFWVFFVAYKLETVKKEYPPMSFILALQEIERDGLQGLK